MIKKDFTKDLIEMFFHAANVSEKSRTLFRGWFLTNRNVIDQNKTLYALWNQVSVERDDSTEADLKAVNLRIDLINEKQRKANIWLRIASIIILPLLVSGITYSVMKNRFERGSIMTQYYVDRGHVRCITLSDSTKVWINSESTLIFPEQFDEQRRVVYLIGEANFHVTKANKRPFIVQTSKMNIEVLGTKFNVEAYPDEEEIIATLEEGKVLVNINDEHKNSFYMSPNEEIALNVKTGNIIKRIVDINDSNAWSKGALAFSGASLEYIFRQIERKYDVRINYSLDSYHTNQCLTIRFAADDSIADVFSILKNMVPGLSIKITNDEIEVNQL